MPQPQAFGGTRPTQTKRTHSPVARMLACAATAWLASAPLAAAPRPLATLPALGDPTKVSISGISSGAAMAVQYAVAHSASVVGVGAIAGPGWGCAQGRVSQALNTCLCTREAPPSTLTQARQMAASGSIDKLAAGKPRALSRAFVFHSQDDATVRARSGDAGIDFLQGFIGRPPMVDRGNAVDGSDHAGHGIVSPQGQDSCQTSARDSSYVRRCGDEDNARDLLHTLMPEVPPDASQRVDDIPEGDVQAFDQTPFIDEVLAGKPYIAPDALWWYVYPYRSERRQRLDMAATGYLYVPPACRSAGARCGVHVALHGCKQDAKAFALTTGYLRWAQLYRQVIVYPAIQPGTNPVSEGCSAGEVPAAADAAWVQPNPNGCWDWWGYLDGVERTRYLSQGAPQVQVIERIVRALTRPR